jgi:hypothetical protein
MLFIQNSHALKCVQPLIFWSSLLIHFSNMLPSSRSIVTLLLSQHIWTGESVVSSTELTPWFFFFLALVKRPLVESRKNLRLNHLKHIIFFFLRNRCCLAHTSVCCNVLWTGTAGWSTRWFKYDRDCFCVNKSQFVPVIFEPPCIMQDDWKLSLWWPWDHESPAHTETPIFT